MVQSCMEAAKVLEAHGISTTVVDARFCKPLDGDLMRRLAREHEILITVEEGSIGGFGSHSMNSSDTETTNKGNCFCFQSKSLIFIFLKFNIYPIIHKHADSFCLRAKWFVPYKTNDVHVRIHERAQLNFASYFTITSQTKFNWFIYDI